MGCDGGMNWAYTHIKGSVTNPGIFWAYVIRSEEGVIDKLEWEGFREGVDDVRYLSTLLDALGRAAGTYGKEPLVAETWTWLSSLDTAKADLKALRIEMARRITGLRAKEKEGDLETLDEARYYLSTLVVALGKAAGPFGKDPLIAETCVWLNGLDVAKADPKAIQAEVGRRITALNGLGEERKSLRESLLEIEPEKLKGAPVGEKWDAEWDCSGGPAEAAAAGMSDGATWNGSRFSPDNPPGFLLTHGNPGGGFSGQVTTNTKAEGWTVEWAFMANANVPPAGISPLEVVGINDDTNAMGVRYSVGTVEMKDHLKPPGPTAAVNLGDYHIYRVVREPGSASVK